MENAPEWHDESVAYMRAPLLIEGQIVGQIGVLGLPKCLRTITARGFSCTDLAFNREATRSRGHDR